MKITAQHKISTALICLLLISCKSTPKQIEPPPSPPAPPVAEALPSPPENTPGPEKLRDLENYVYQLEDKVYGSRKLATVGLYGDLKACKRKLASRQFGGAGEMVWSEPLDRLTEKEEEFRASETGELATRNRLRRFQNYRSILQKRYEEFRLRIEACEADAATKELDENESNQVMVSEVPKTSFERAEMDRYLCEFVKPGASLEAFMLEAYARGWLALSDFRADQNLIAVALKDSKGQTRENALLFNGWKLAFDKKLITVANLLNEDRDAKLVSWAHSKKADIPDSAGCLKAADGQWNP